jgi:hypothetical protein
MTTSSNIVEVNAPKADNETNREKVDLEPPRETRFDRLIRELDEGIKEMRRCREEAKYWGRVARERGE